jgi:hypothetical protein
MTIDDPWCGHERFRLTSLRAQIRQPRLVTLSGQRRRAASDAAAVSLSPRPRRNSLTAVTSGSHTTALFHRRISVIENCSATTSIAVSASKLNGSPQPGITSLRVVVSARGACHEYATGPQYPCDLSEDDEGLGHVVEHPERRDGAKTAIEEGQLRRICLHCG